MNKIVILSFVLLFVVQVLSNEKTAKKKPEKKIFAWKSEGFGLLGLTLRPEYAGITVLPSWLKVSLGPFTFTTTDTIWGCASGKVRELTTDKIIGTTEFCVTLGLVVVQKFDIKGVGCLYLGSYISLWLSLPPGTVPIPPLEAGLFALISGLNLGGGGGGRTGQRSASDLVFPTNGVTPDEISRAKAFIPAITGKDNGLQGLVNMLNGISEPRVETQAFGPQVDTISTLPGTLEPFFPPPTFITIYGGTLSSTLDSFLLDSKLQTKYFKKFRFAKKCNVDYSIKLPLVSLIAGLVEYLISDGDITAFTVEMGTFGWVTDCLLST